jgi:hypothetical protein
LTLLTGKPGKEEEAEEFSTGQSTIASQLMTCRGCAGVAVEELIHTISMLELDESYVWDARRSLFKVNFVLGTSGIRRELGKKELKTVDHECVVERMMQREKACHKLMLDNIT